MSSFVVGLNTYNDSEFFVTFKFKRKDNNIFQEILSNIEKADALDEELYEELKQFASTVFIRTAKEIMDIAKDPTVEIASLLAVAKSYSKIDSDLLFNLGKYYENEGSTNDALSCYQELNSENSHYQEARHSIAMILLNYLKSEVNLSDSEIQEYNTQILECLIASGENVTVDRIFDEMCGGNGLEVNISNISISSETLIKLAKEIKNQKTEITKSRRECQLLKLEKDDLQEKRNFLELKISQNAAKKKASNQWKFFKPENVALCSAVAATTALTISIVYKAYRA